VKLMDLVCIFLIGSLFTPAFGQDKESSRRKGTLEVGDPAPDFNLEVLSGNSDVNEAIRLSNFARWKKP